MVCNFCVSICGCQIIRFSFSEYVCSRDLTDYRDTFCSDKGSVLKDGRDRGFGCQADRGQGWASGASLLFQESSDQGREKKIMTFPR